MNESKISADQEAWDDISVDAFYELRLNPYEVFRRAFGNQCNDVVAWAQSSDVATDAGNLASNVHPES
ncbi:hypothetical protein Trco_007579 [Trichoderma cornu-damae]|uniref:Uncharacterized protein n=1 Tax=Trichoderma cornu-damae TaxID=654480 RepID=A0A9P8TTD0_9HYPO|nr:hypothetical protein Trco_007579 [Trichoderma cornu-damae]